MGNYNAKRNNKQVSTVDVVKVSAQDWMKLMRREEAVASGGSLVLSRKELPEAANDRIQAWKLFGSMDLCINTRRRSGVTMDVRGAQRIAFAFSKNTARKELHEMRDLDRKEVSAYIDIFEAGLALEFLANRRRANAISRLFGVDAASTRNGFERDGRSRAVLDTQRNRHAADECMLSLINTLIRRHTSFYARI